jgi:hypothetical protein
MLVDWWVTGSDDRARANNNGFIKLKPGTPSLANLIVCLPKSEVIDIAYCVFNFNARSNSLTTYLSTAVSGGLCGVSQP